jgi:hypothetical protein
LLYTSQTNRFYPPRGKKGGAYLSACTAHHHIIIIISSIIIKEGLNTNLSVSLRYLYVCNIVIVLKPNVAYTKDQLHIVQPDEVQPDKIRKRPIGKKMNKDVYIIEKIIDKKINFQKSSLVFGIMERF